MIKKEQEKEINEIKEALKDFVLRVTKDGINKSPEEVEVLPEMTQTLLNLIWYH